MSCCAISTTGLGEKFKSYPVLACGVNLLVTRGEKRLRRSLIQVQLGRKLPILKKNGNYDKHALANTLSIADNKYDP